MILRVKTANILNNLGVHIGVRMEEKGKHVR